MHEITFYNISRQAIGGGSLPTIDITTRAITAPVYFLEALSKRYLVHKACFDVFGRIDYSSQGGLCLLRWSTSKKFQIYEFSKMVEDIVCRVL